jgi:hypothetical protein
MNTYNIESIYNPNSEIENLNDITKKNQVLINLTLKAMIGVITNKSPHEKPIKLFLFPTLSIAFIN